MKMIWTMHPSTSNEKILKFEEELQHIEWKTPGISKEEVKVNKPLHLGVFFNTQEPKIVGRLGFLIDKKKQRTS